MPALRLNGLEIPLSENAQRQREVLEDAERSVTGDLLRTRIGLKEGYQCETTPIPATLARDIEGLLQGECDHWSFDDTDWEWSEAGVAKYSGTASTSSTPSPKYGATCLIIPAGTRILWSADVGAAWTLMVWKWDGTAWDHYAKDASGNVWINGVAGGMAIFLDVVSGRVALGATTTVSDQEFDDLVLCRWEASEALIRAVSEASGSFRAPNVRASGDLLQALVAGEEVSSDYQPHVTEAGWDDYGQVVRFTLREV